MSILIKGMDMPREGSWKIIHIYPDGTCTIPNWQGDCTFIQGAKAIPIPPHGRLIDADALMKKGMPLSFSVQKWVQEVDIACARTIIEAEEE